MIDNLINILNELNIILQNKIAIINEQNNDKKIISIIDNILNGNVISETDITDLKNAFGALAFKYPLKYTENDISKFNFTLILLSKNINFDESQKDLYKKTRQLLSEYLTNENIVEIKNQIDINNKVINALKSDSVFDLFEELESVFDKIDISKRDKILIVKEIILRNISKASILDVSSEEPSNKQSNQTDIIYNNSIEDIDKILKKYGYDVYSFSQSNKEILVKYAVLSDIDQILQAMQKNDIHIAIENKKKEYTFVKILIESSADIINEFVKICNENGFDINLFTTKFSNVLYPNNFKRVNKKKPQNEQQTQTEELSFGAFNYFKANVEYFKSKEFNINDIFDSCITVFMTNPDSVKMNIEVLEKIYDIKFTGAKGFTGIRSGNAISILDKFIESADIGYEYIKNNKSKLWNTDELKFYKIRIMEDRGDSLFYLTSTGLIRCSLRQTGINSLEQAIEEFKPQEINIPAVDKYKLLPIDLFDEIDPSIFSNGYIAYLEENCKVNKYLYVIGNTRVSRQKVLRICMNFRANGITLKENEIIFALAYESILNEQDVLNIKNFKYLKANDLSGGRITHG